MRKNEFDDLLNCYPQLRLPISWETKTSAQYKDAILRGRPVTTAPCVVFCTEDDLLEKKTAFGSVRLWKITHREQFERAVQALAYRCEPREIPRAVGAQYIGGLANWERIRKHKCSYLASGGTDWNAEFRRYTQNKENYTDSLILLSTGYYSGLSPEEVVLPPEIWKEASGEIRKYHELTHFIYRKCYPGDIQVIRDEVLADCVGLCAAFDRYDASLARKLLGLDNGTLRPDARLRHYVPEDALPQAMNEAALWINGLEKLLSRVPDLSKRQRESL